MFLPAGEASFFALLPYEVKEIKVETNKSKIKPGEVLKYNINIKTGSGETSSHVVRIEVYNPAGEIMPFYSMNLVTHGGRAEGYFRTALDDQKGEWTIKFIDVPTGISSKTNFFLTY